MKEKRKKNNDNRTKNEASPQQSIDNNWNISTKERGTYLFHIFSSMCVCVHWNEATFVQFHTNIQTRVRTLEAITSFLCTQNKNGLEM